MKLKNRSILTLERLEDRLTPSYTFTYNSTSDLMTITQTNDDGATTISLSGGTLTLTDGAGTADMGFEPGNLTVNMLAAAISGADTLNVTLNDPLLGNLTLNLNNGTRTTTLDGASNTVGGNLSISSGTASQTAALSSAALLTVGGAANINLGLGSDIVTAASGVSVGTNLGLTGVNTFTPAAPVSVGGSLNFNAASELQADTLTLPAATVINSSLTYSGNAAADLVTLNTTSVGGSVNLNLSGGANSVTLNDGSVGGSTSVTSGLGNDSFTSTANTSFARGVYLNLGDGANTATIAGIMGSFASAQITTGAGADSITYSAGGNASVTAFLGAGNDTFTLSGGTTSIRSLYVDFGPGTDSFVNGYGRPIPNMTLLNLP